MPSELGNFIGKALIKIIKKQGGRKAVEEVRKYFKENPWPNSASKETTLKFIHKLINCEQLEDNPFVLLMDAMSGIEYRPKRTKEQLKWLHEIVDIITKAEGGKRCSHSNLGIAPFLHGGGFTRILAFPEIICLDCGLNVTVTRQRGASLEKTMTDMGIEITETSLNELQAWATECLNNREKRVSFSDTILTDPIQAYKSSNWKWNSDIPFKIVDAKKLEACSGK